MIVLHPTEFSKPFVKTSTGFAVKMLEQLIGATVLQFEQNQWAGLIASGRVGEYSPEDIDIIIFEGTYMETNGLTTADLRRAYKNSKLVCLSSDAVYFILSGKTNGMQFSDVRDCDLFLDQMSLCLDTYSKIGAITDRWMWTASKPFIDYCETNYGGSTDPSKKDIDLIGVYSPHTLEQPGYRKDMTDFVREAGLIFSQGGGTGHSDTNLEAVLESYSRSWFTLGTSSHSSPLLNDKWCCKGFRDFIGPFMNSLLIYDNNPDIEKYYCPDIPKYTFGKFNEIIDIVNYYKNNLQEYTALLEKQRCWTRLNTIEIQLVDLFEKHGIISQRKYIGYKTESFQLKGIIETINGNHPFIYGDIYEFGVYGGNSLKEIRKAFNELGIVYKNIYGFDSFEGLPAEQCGVKCRPQWVKGSFDVRPMLSTWDADKAHKQINNEFPYDTYIFKCWYKDLNRDYVNSHNMTSASFISIDCDLYISAYQALDFMFSNNLVKHGTVIRFDDSNGIEDDEGERLAEIEIWAKYKVKAETVNHNTFVILDYGKK